MAYYAAFLGRLRNASIFAAQVGKWTANLTPPANTAAVRKSSKPILKRVIMAKPPNIGGCRRKRGEVLNYCGYGGRSGYNGGDKRRSSYPGVEIWKEDGRHAFADFNRILGFVAEFETEPSQESEDEIARLHRDFVGIVVVLGGVYTALVDESASYAVLVSHYAA